MTPIPHDATVSVNVRAFQHALRDVATILRQTRQVGKVSNMLDELSERLEQMYRAEQLANAALEKEPPA